jgi:3-oxoacyl-(acyl-carrier-protein) synthase
MRRVVITGLGAITSLGNTINDFWKSIENSLYTIIKN